MINIDNKLFLHCLGYSGQLIKYNYKWFIEIFELLSLTGFCIIDIFNVLMADRPTCISGTLFCIAVDKF